MLPSPHIIFTAIEGSLLDPASRKWSAAEEALVELERRQVPLILVTGGTRAQIEPLRSKLGHTQPFITENGSGLFLPDGYFSMKLDGAVRMARYFCVPFAKDYAAATAALEEIADEAGASVVGFSQMSPREIAGNTGGPLREAELAHQRDFSERFFFRRRRRCGRRAVCGVGGKEWMAGESRPSRAAILGTLLQQRSGASDQAPDAPLSDLAT